MSTPDHKVWGEPEVLSCYSSSTNSRSGGQGSWSSINRTKQRQLPQELQHYLRHSVFKVRDTSECSSHSVHSNPEVGQEGAAAAAAAAAAGRPDREREHLAENITEGHEGSEADLDAAGEQLAGAGGLPSAGSELHESRQCRPCMYLYSKTGCINGQACSFCHLSHPKKNRPRPCKATRMQCKQLANMLDAFSPDPEQMLKATELLGERSAYMRTVLKGKQRQLQEETGSRTSGAASAATCRFERPPCGSAGRFDRFERPSSGAAASSAARFEDERHPRAERKLAAAPEEEVVSI